MTKRTRSLLMIGSLLGISLAAWLLLRPVDPRARVLPNETGLTFVIENLPSDAEPELAVFSDADLGDFLRPTESKNSRTLPNLALTKFPAVTLSYRWNLGAEQIKGEYLYISKDYQYPWRVGRDGGLTVYYATDAVQAELPRWGALNDWVPAFLGTSSQPVVIYAMPDEESYNRIIKGYGQLGRASAFWNENRRWVVLPPGQMEEALVAHELAHAYTMAKYPIWWEEGVASWVQANFRARTKPQATWGEYQQYLRPLAEQAATTPVRLAKTDYDSPAPGDSYRVGLSFFLFLEQRYGPAKVKQLALAAHGAPGQEVFQQTLGSSLEQVQAEWQKALASGELIRWLGERSWR